MIDGSNLLHRTYWIAKSNKKGINNVSELGGYCLHLYLKSLRSYIEKFLPDRIYIAWDKKIKWPSTNFRKLLLEGTYKGTRDHSSAEKVFEQEEKLEELMKSLGIPCFYPYVLEADDIIGWLSSEMAPNVIISVDNDFLQLVDNNTSFYNPHKKQLITPVNFDEQVGVPLDSFLYYKAILGDASDNIPGFPGYGKVRSRKLAIQLTKNNGNLKSLNLSNEYYNIFEKNMALMNLKCGYTVEQDELEHYRTQLEESKSLKADFYKFEKLCDEIGLNSIKDNILEWEAVFTFNKPLNILDILGK